MDATSGRSGESNEEFGPWNPGLSSSIPSKLLPLSTMFRSDCAAVSYQQAKELSDFSGMSIFDVATFLPERLIVHEILVRVTADLMVPDGPEYEELGINLRFMTRRIYDDHVVPKLYDLRRQYADIQTIAAEIISNELLQLRSPKKAPESPKPSFWQRLKGNHRKQSPSLGSTTPLWQSRFDAAENKGWRQ